MAPAPCLAAVGGDQPGQHLGQLAAEAFQGAGVAQVAGFAGEAAGGPVDIADGHVQLGAGLGPGRAGHQRPSWWQTGQRRRAARRSQRCWVRAVVSCQPQVGHDAIQMPPSGCRVGSGC
jgi:hypothetical protein